MSVTARARLVVSDSTRPEWPAVLGSRCSIAVTLACTKPSNSAWIESRRPLLSRATAAWLAMDSIISRSSGGTPTISLGTLALLSFVPHLRGAAIGQRAPAGAFLYDRRGAACHD